MSPRSIWLRAAAIAAVAAQAAGQQCYYPNRGRAPDTEKPCSTAEGSACCPDNWECLDNGLCYYPPTKLYGRYSCTDQDWNSPGCASSMCTYAGFTRGGESITQCSNHDNQWCCNGDAQNVNCCQESPSPRPFFSLPEGTAYATIGARQASTVPYLATISGPATLGPGGNGGFPMSPKSPMSPKTPSGSPATSAAGSRQPTVTPDAVSASPPPPFTSVATRISSGPAGVATIVITSIITPTPTANTGSATDAPSSSDGGNSNLGVIVGCAVGILLVLALAGLFFWVWRKRRNPKAHPYQETPELTGDSPTSPNFGGGAAAKAGQKQDFRQSHLGTAEIDGNPLGAGGTISTINGHAELPAGQGFQPGHGTPFAPDTVGLGGGNAERETWTNGPPQYSPAHNQAAFAHAHSNAIELADTSVVRSTDEKNEAPQSYPPYRPSNPATELPSIKTPPDDLEKQVRT